MQEPSPFPELAQPPVQAAESAGATLTFVFSDIEGSTRLEQAIGTVAYGAIRERHRALLRAAFAAHGGEEQGTEGDSFFVVFRSARGAIAAALAAQRALAAEPWPEGAEVRVRMGVHSGEARTHAGSLLGIDINRAARIAAVAHGGQVLVSEVARSLVRDEGQAGISFRDLGSHRLKDLDQPEQLHQLVADGLRGEFPPLRTIGARPNTLPAQLTSFVGRATERAAVDRLLAGHRLVTLTGPGGTGKTRLSIEVAGHAADSFPDGIFFVPLDAVRDPGLVASQIAGALGLSESGGRPARDLVVDWLARRTALLVLDNFEQVVDAAPFVADLLRSVPGLKLIVTSRASLRISGEHEYPVPGLPAPPDLSGLSAMERAQLPLRDRVVDAEGLATYESVRLFIERATAVRPGFQVTNDNAPAIAAICAKLQGMPLAIELAAARVRVLSPDAILARLTSQLTALGAGSRDLPERQQTLRGAIAWSYDILDAGDRRLLERLSVFRGGIDLEAAEAVCGPAEELHRDVVDGLGELADQSLLRVVDGGEARFQMLETIREFAAEMLVAHGEGDLVRGRFGAWFLGLAERARPLLAGPDQRTWLDRLEMEHDNLRAALDRATAAGDAGTAIGLAFALWRFWQMRGHLFEARLRLDAMSAAPWSRQSPVLHARLLEALGGVCWWQADVAAMRVAYEEAVTLWRAAGNRSELANALYNYSFCFTISPNPREAASNTDPDGIGWASLQEALELYRALGDERGQANVLWGIGNKEYFSNDPTAGVATLTEALGIYRRVGDRTMEAWALHMLGAAKLRLGDLEASRGLFAGALRLFQGSGDASGLTLVFDDFASQAAYDGDPERAARLWGAARSLTASTGAGLASYVDQFLDQFLRPTAQAMLSPEEVARLAAEGAAMTIDQVVAYALESGEAPSGS
ncbi:MAG: adenylate/guanylate cyclase domain-containing protein [Candidatus Limnocylindrales bacterium]|nr:adenylate/guanylate cyclase domain-containing protein [Candidatus Limnocylindrales bacterium]